MDYKANPTMFYIQAIYLKKMTQAENQRLGRNILEITKHLKIIFMVNMYSMDTNGWLCVCV